LDSSQVAANANSLLGFVIGNVLEN